MNVPVQEKLVLKGFLITTWLPSSERLVFRFKVDRSVVDLDKLEKTLRPIVGKVKIESRKNNFTVKVEVPILQYSARRLERIRNRYFEQLKQYTIVIQRLEEIGFWRNIYLLPATNLAKFLEEWDKIKKQIEDINDMIRREMNSEKTKQLVQALRKLGLETTAAELEKLMDNPPVLPEPKLRLNKLTLSISELADMVEDPALRDRVRRILEKQYKEQIQSIFESVKDQVKQIVKQVVEAKTYASLIKARNELRQLAKKIKDIGLVGLSQVVDEIASHVDPWRPLSEKEIDDMFENARMIL